MTDLTGFIPGLMLWVGILLIREDRITDKWWVIDKIVGLFFIVAGLIYGIDRFLLN